MGGFIAGAINTLAGYGSIITLSLLMDFGGLTPNVANGTNRVGILANGLAGALGFYQQGKLNVKRATPFIIIALIGAIPGIYLAIIVDNEQFRNVYRLLVITLFFFMLTSPKNWLIKETLQKRNNWFVIIPIFLAIGFYGGFIQFGLGLFILSALVLYSKIELIEANAIKLVLIAVYSILAIAIFHYNGMIDWKLGLIMAVGQALGSYLTAKFAVRIPNITTWAYRLLILIIAIIISKEVYLLWQEW